MSEEPCPCGSGKSYAGCCQGIIEGTRAAATAEALMRARYSAYAKGAVDFLIDSVHSSQRDGNNRDEIKKWSEESEWTGMEVVRTEQGGESDHDGVVEFIARYTSGGVPREHHEISTFRRENGKWVFFDGKMVGAKPFVREEPKIGRNDPCPCGSGKKYKKCCGR